MFRQVKSISDERILGAAGGSTLRSLIFVLIESGMVLFSIQLFRLVIASILVWTDVAFKLNNVYPFIIGIHQMLNVIIRSDIFLLFILLIICGYIGHNTYNHSSASVDGILFPRREFHGGSY